MSIRNKDEPNTAPVPDQWYPLTVGNSFKDDQQPSSKFCTLRYEFKPASIDKTQPGTLHKTKDNKISVEFNNNQLGKPKATFEGSSEDYKENDAVLFFDGHTLRLERLHTAVKRLRHNRLPGESSAATSAGTASVDPTSPPLGKGAKGQVQNLNTRPSFTPPQPPPPPPPPPPMSVEIERIDIGDAGGGSGENTKNEKSPITPPAQPTTATSTPTSGDLDFDLELSIMNEDDDDNTVAAEPVKSNSEEKPVNIGIDINVPHQHDTDDEIAVDVNDDDDGMVRNAAEALRARVIAEEGSSNSSDSSGGSESSDCSSGSSSTSSGSESSDGDSVNSI